MYPKNGDVYPKERQLNKENVDEKRATFLDLEEEINNNIIHVKTYNKLETFKFEIVNCPDLSGNIPRKPADGIYSSQIIHYARSCSKERDLIARIKDLTKKQSKRHLTAEKWS